MVIFEYGHSYYFYAAKLISECFDLRKEDILQKSELRYVSFYGVPVIPKYFLFNLT